VSKRDKLWSQPIAKVLLPMAKMQCSSPADSRHASKIFMQIVDSFVPEDGAGPWDEQSPGSAREAVPAESIRTGVRPADLVRFPGDQKVHGDPFVRVLEKFFPPVQVFQGIGSQLPMSLPSPSGLEPASDLAHEVSGVRDNVSHVV
jgi:hypothetical protein